jgi:beta-lactam-binding protein with PASTA domain
VAGYPPVAGPGNFPPNIKQGGGGGGGGKVAVPNVVGVETGEASRIIESVGLKASHPPLKSGRGSTVTGESPKAGSQVKSGSTVHLTIKEKK